MTGRGWRLAHSYAQLPEAFHVDAQPAAAAAPRVLLFNDGLAATLGLDLGGCADADLAALFTGQRLPPGSRPLAQAYAGHQYGHFTMLGDGRALLLGEQTTPDGRVFDIQFKGSGPTAFSRGGDGKAALAPMLREYVISEAMHALGIPTTRSLAVAITGDAVWREGAVPGAVLTRIASSHLRVGTLEYAAVQAQQQEMPALLRSLADYAIDRHYPEARDAEQPYRALLSGIALRQAELVAQWLAVGFVHGVMNTDNMALSGETIDYGPCAFIDAYDPATVFSSIDRHGRYAYGQQPRIAAWNLARCAEALLPLLGENEDNALASAGAVLDGFAEQFERAWQSRLRAKLGLAQRQEGDEELGASLLALMHAERADFTNTFCRLGADAPAADEAFPGTGALFANSEFHGWRQRWLARLARQALVLDAPLTMRAVNPAVIARNRQVESALDAAVQGDLQPLRKLLEVLADPFDASSSDLSFRTPAPAGPYRTFCGT
ncbi:MAG TPA: YdiU family protein [Arenimonas sp.]|nr:YdiU family protein [Arenimonas sp.]